MKNSFLIGAGLLTSLLASNASAVDLFTFDGPQASQSAKQADGKIASPSAFSAKFNPVAMDQESIDINLPHKVIAAKRMSIVGSASEQITPYAFETQKGSVTVNSNNNKIESLTIFDAQANEVFKGEVQVDGSIAFTQVDIDAFICSNYDKVSNSSGLQAADTSYYQSLNSLTQAQVTTLQSRPGASKTLYIDYFAGSVTGTAWNVDNNITEIVYDNYSYDSDASTFSLIDRQSMYAGWAETAEDYAPFDVNVTTDLSVYQAASHINKSKIIATSTNWRNSGGVAYVNAFGIRNDNYYNIGWTFNSSFGSLGMTNAHESGHQMGLSHDGTSTLVYYGGSGNAGPIMGGPFGKDFVHWNNGSYTGANQPQDDIAIIQGKLGVVTDDHGNDNNTATPINAQEIIGFISPAGLAADIDVFSFTLASGRSVSLTVRSLFEQAFGSGDNTAGGLNLSAKIELRDSSGTLIQQQLPSNNAANNNFSFSQNLAADTYYLTIEPQAYSPSDFNEYGNGGFYQILNDLTSIQAPDLVVEAPSVSASNVDAGDAFVLSATPKNQGNAVSASTTLTYYRSSDSTISTSDVSLGTDGVASFAAGASAPESINLAAPTSPGDYYYGACITSVSGELNTTNNCSAGALLTVAATIDLIVESPAVDISALVPSQTFQFSASIKNQGNANSSATTLTYYRSSNSIISVSDSSVGTDAVGVLAANGSSPESISLDAPAEIGSYYYGACVTTVSGETTSNNNCSAGVLVTVAAAPTIDLVVESPAVSDDSLTPSQTFQLSASVKNQGNSSSLATTLTYYRSSNSIISVSDSSVGTDAVGVLAANGSSPESISLNAPAEIGSYYYGACVTTVSGETTSNNNCSAGVLVTVATAPTIDLIVESPAVNDDSLTPSQSFQLSASVKNQGNSSSSATTLTYYRSADSIISVSDSSVGTDAVGVLAANGSSPESISLDAPAEIGSYYYGACVTTVSGETTSNNNCSAGVLVTVAAAPTIDLVVESPAVSDDSLTPSQTFQLSASVRNQGNSSSLATTLTYYRSADSTISVSDSSVGTDAVGVLAANGSSSESISLNAPSTAGEYYFGACVTAPDNETVSDNNCSLGVLVTVSVEIAADSYEPDNDSASANGISNGGAQSHTIHEFGDIDWLEVTLLNDANNLTIETVGSNSDDTELTLYDSNLVQLAFNDDIEANIDLNSKISLDATLAAGTYFIRVNEFGNDDLITNYTVTVNFDSVADEVESLCLPIKATNGRIAFICL